MIANSIIDENSYKRVVEILLDTELKTIEDKIKVLEKLDIKNLYDSVSAAVVNASVGIYTQTIEKYMENKTNLGEKIQEVTLNSFIENAFHFSILLSANCLTVSKEIKLFLFIVSCIIMMSLVGFVKPEGMIEYFIKVCKENKLSMYDILKGLILFIEILDLKNEKINPAKFLH